MIRHISGIHVACMFILAAVLSSPAWGEQNELGPASLPVIYADQPDSVLIIETARGDFSIRVVTSSDVQPVESLLGEVLDPKLPARTASEIRDPITGEVLNINIVEVGVRTMETSGGLNPLGSAELLINNDRPFTRSAELAAAVRGEGVRVENDITVVPNHDPVCWITGEPIVEIFVLVPMGGEEPRSAVPSYGIIVLANGSVIDRSGGDGDGGEGGTPGGSADPPMLIQPAHPVVEGGTPGGDPDIPGRSRG
jgi:hypothetical protein